MKSTTQELATILGNANGVDKQASGEIKMDGLIENIKEPEDESAKQLREFRPIPDTPFTAVKTDDKWILVMGRHKMSGPWETYEQCVEDSTDASWIRILMVVQVVIEDNLQELNLNPKNSNE